MVGFPLLLLLLLVALVGVLLEGLLSGSAGITTGKGGRGTIGVDC